MYDLRPYQTDAINAINEHWEDWQRELLVLPTGCGKTVVFNEIARQKAPGVLILAHRDELIEQARQKFGAVTGSVTKGNTYKITIGYQKGLVHTITIDKN